MTHDMLYELMGAFNLLVTGWLLGERSGLKRGAYFGAKQAVLLLEERGFLIDPEEDES